MKTWKVFWGIGFILAAVLIILDVMGVLAPLSGMLGEVSLISLVVGLFLLAFVISRLCKGRIASTFFPLALIFLLFEKNIAKLCNLPSEDIMNNWLVLLIALLFTIGFSILFSSSKKKASKTIFVKQKRAESSLGNASVYVDSATMTPGIIENNLGLCNVYFENPHCYTGGGAITVENNLGSLVLNVPASWNVHNCVENHLGMSSVPIKKKADGPTLTIYGENNLGSLSILYV